MQTYKKCGKFVLCSKWLVKLSPAGVNFINILRMQFSYKISAPKISTQNMAYIQNLGDKNSLLYKKRARKKLMELTVGLINFIDIIS